MKFFKLKFKYIPVMKKQIVFLLILLLGTFTSAQAQSKKDLEKQLKEANAKNDSLQKANEALKAKADSGKISIAPIDTASKTITLEVTKVTGDSAVVVVKRDTMVSKNDSLTKVVSVNSDTVKKTGEPSVVVAPVIKNTPKTTGYQPEDLRTENEHLKYIINQYFGKGTIPLKADDFHGLWLMSMQYFKITDDSAKSGLINVPAPPDIRTPVRIIFIDFELAEVSFSSGEPMKCFYKINAFSSTQPYSIDLTKGPELNVRLQVNPTSGTELQVSYKKGNGYFTGYMRKML